MDSSIVLDQQTETRSSEAMENKIHVIPVVALATLQPTVLSQRLTDYSPVKLTSSQSKLDPPLKVDYARAQRKKVVG